MKDNRPELWNFTRIYKALVIIFSAGCLGGALIAFLGIYATVR